MNNSALMLHLWLSCRKERSELALNNIRKTVNMSRERIFEINDNISPDYTQISTPPELNSKNTPLERITSNIVTKL